MAKRLNVERTLNNRVFKTKIGSVNRLNPVSIYITGKAYISPVEDLDTYEESIDLLDHDLKTILRRYTAKNTFVNKVFISNLEVPKNGLKYGKNTYLFFQLFFSQNFSNPVCKSIDEICEKMSPGVNEVLNEFEAKIHERGFTIHEKRK
jgi:hypothetical protein